MALDNIPENEPAFINLNADVDGDPTVLEVPHPDKPIGFRCPVRIYVVGPSQSGKSTWVLRLVNEMDDWFDCKFTTLFYLHPATELGTGSRDDHIIPLQNACEKHNVMFNNISGTVDDFFRKAESMIREHRLLVIDDLYQKITDSEAWAEMFQRISHSKFLSIILLSQNYYSGKQGPAIRRNCSEFVLFKSLREKNYVTNIANDLLKGNAAFLTKCFDWVADNSENAYDRYIVIDRNEGSDPFLPRHHLQYFGVKTNLFKDEKTGERLVVYFPCSSLK